ncbi:hypothetical protein HZB69_01195 [Candidatus Amesbacteria bacterium]|nr:hypothetical protein [Candidatus Amesbacteria bacterium]
MNTPIRHLNLILLVVGLVLAWILKSYDFTTLGILGAFVGGVMFASVFTVASGTIILLSLANTFPIWQVAIIAGLGAIITNFFIFRFVRDNLYNEIKDVYEFFGHRHLTTLLHTKYFHWFIPLLGALIIASPLPDEFGVSLLGISQMSQGKFLALAFVLNTIGISLILVVQKLL